MSDVKCGTRAGWNAHMRKGEKACDPCNRANTLYARDYRQSRGKRPISFPIEAPAHDVGLGATIARSLRESA